MKNPYSIDNNWTLKLLSANDVYIPQDFKIPEQGIPVNVPGTVHSDLFDKNLIPDPFYSDNELSLQWIAECDWQYETVFDLPDDFNQEDAANLVFEGLDTIAEVVLNDEVVGNAENMFIKYNFALNEILRPKNNRLVVKFRSPLKYVQENKLPIKQFPSARHPDRVFIRKAQYSFGWDWGPAYPTMGIWKNVYLEQVEKIKIESIRFNTLSIENKHAKTEVLVNLQLDLPDTFTVEAVLSSGNLSVTGRTMGKKNTELKIAIDVTDAKLWWPSGSGTPNLYDLDVRVFNAQENILEHKHLKVGIRTIELCFEKDGKNAFYFVINSKPIFLKGANWIPVDSFIPRKSAEVYENLIQAAKDANMNVLRVWGGGIYEQEIFYELCDKLGIFVWQDFMFACAGYPEYESFLDNVKTEAEQNILRIQHHPSIAIWCGNNENEWIWYRDTGHVAKTMAGYGIFHQLLPEITKKLDPHRPYWPTTPFGNEDDPNSETSGNRHSWDIWSRWLDYKEVKHDKSLFVSEFGFQGPANFHTLQKSMPADDFRPQSKVFEFHNKQDEGPERLLKFLGQHLPVKMKTEDFIYLTQLNQGLALQSCLEHWRLQWPETAGSIIWQINDVWPVSSWALIDSDLRTKLAYHFSTRVFAQQLLAFNETNDGIDLMFLNYDSIEFKGRLNVVKYWISDGTLNEVQIDEFTNSQFNAREKTVVHNFDSAAVKDCILIATLFNDRDEIINRNHFLKGEWKHQTLPETENDISLKFQLNEKKLNMSTSQTSFFVMLQHPDLQFSDNGFILLSSENKSVFVKGNIQNDFNVDDIKVFSLNQYLA